MSVFGMVVSVLGTAALLHAVTRSQLPSIKIKNLKEMPSRNRNTS